MTPWDAMGIHDDLVFGLPGTTAITKQACKGNDSAIYHPFEE
jgi:hypothetical protein